MSSAGDNLKFWHKNKHKVIQQLEDRGIYGCEMRLDDKCTGNLFTTLAHRHKRSWYLGEPELLIDINQVVCACVNCHQVSEYDRELTEKLFKRIRPLEMV